MDRFIELEELINICEELKKDRLQVHHTWEPSHNDFDGKNYMKLVYEMRNLHVNIRKWSDIAQHISLFPDGKMVTGRNFEDKPRGIFKKNRQSDLCVEMVGNFDIGHDEFCGMQKKVILCLAAYFLDKYGEDGVVFHNEYSEKTCPGSSIIKTEFVTEARKITEKVRNEYKYKK